MTRRWAPLLILILVTTAPPAASWLLFLNPQLRPAVHANGQLVEPEPLAHLVLKTPTGGLLPLSRFDDRWVLLLQAQRCHDACQELLWGLRQVRLALGADRERIERLLVLHQPPNLAVAAMIRQEHPGLHVAVSAEPGRQALQLGLTKAGGGEGSIYLIDPRGNLMMHFPPGTSARELLEDLERLMKISATRGRHAGY